MRNMAFGPTWQPLIGSSFQSWLRRPLQALPREAAFAWHCVYIPSLGREVSALLSWLEEVHAQRDSMIRDSDSGNGDARSPVHAQRDSMVGDSERQRKWGCAQPCPRWVAGLFWAVRQDLIHFICRAAGGSVQSGSRLRKVHSLVHGCKRCTSFVQK
jgi:hypothetical protein